MVFHKTFDANLNSDIFTQAQWFSKWGQLDF